MPDSLTVTTSHCTAPMMHPAQTTPELAWNIVLCAHHLRHMQNAETVSSIGLSVEGLPTILEKIDPFSIITAERNAWRYHETLVPAVKAMFDLYLPNLSPSSDCPWVIGHLGQSLDGHIATENGDSCYVTGSENLTHLHRMRALSDAIIVGAGTVTADNPRLTTRRVAGNNPVRVVLDPVRRLRDDYQIFSDGLAATLVICAAGQLANGEVGPGQAMVAEVPAQGRRLDLACLLALLHARGCHRLFVEGGGTTVSGFLQAGLLDRLQIAVAPLIIGSGRPSIHLPAITSLDACLRPPARVFRMGKDMLFDFDMRSTPCGSETITSTGNDDCKDLQRII